ncbi:MAG: glycosyltransferase family 2 protein [Rhodomicrobium sp.]|nr:glycosyltransferase family 2 protein [Rhodomicrobium sp.]
MMTLGVSVIVAARNAEATIAKAVRSALAQPAVSEVIVVDDVSTDRTAAAASRADDGSGRLKILTAPANLGPAGARNLALERSAAPYFCVLDADDYMLPGRLTKLLASANGDWDLIADDIIILPQSSGLTFSLRRDAYSLRHLDLESFALGNISRPGRPRGELGFLKPVVSRAFMYRNDLRYDESLRLGEDYAFYLRALLGGARFALVSACGYVAVERHDSLSSNHSGEDLRRIMMFDEAILSLYPDLKPGERAALAKHRDATWRKHVHAEALDLKREKGIAQALAFLGRAPAALPHVLAETVRAKSKGMLHRLLPPPSRDSRRLRLLMGLPGARLADIRPAGQSGELAFDAALRSDRPAA